MICCEIKVQNANVLAVFENIEDCSMAFWGVLSFNNLLLIKSVSCTSFIGSIINIILLTYFNSSFLQLHNKFDSLKKQHAEELKHLEEERRKLDDEINLFNKRKMAEAAALQQQTSTMSKRKKWKQPSCTYWWAVPGWVIGRALGCFYGPRYMPVAARVAPVYV